MSELTYKIYQCDHCGYEVNTEQGNGDDGWLHENGSYSLPKFDLCPNCKNELIKFLTAGPQHERRNAMLEVKAYARQQFPRHPSGNSRMFVGTTEFNEIITTPEFDR